ncbi:MAG: HNH endonuclease [Acidobacteriota bacterium]
MNSGTVCEVVGPTWDEVHHALVAIARRRAALDAEEASWLREAEAQQIWRPLGMVSALDYMERALGYSPHAARERLRVARALADLPTMTEALATGTLAFSAVRELSRVATRTTEGEWVDAARDKNLRQIEELVAGHRPGDRPDDPPDPDVRPRIVRIELQPETYAMWRQARVQLEAEHGSHLDDDAFVAALVHGALATTEPTGRAKYQVGVTVCASCKQAWQHGGGGKVAIGKAAMARVDCDAQRVDEAGRVRQDVPPSVARLVWQRDAGRCRVPGCRSARGLEIHHLVHREHGGTHAPSNLVLVCSSCHQAHHDGRLAISGTAEQVEVRRPSHVGLRHDASGALERLGYKPAIARIAVDEAARALGADAPLERLLYDALRRCRELGGTS